MTNSANKQSTSKAGRNLPAAIGVAALLLVPLIVGLLWLKWVFIVFVAVMLSLGVWEVSNALRQKGMHAATVPIMIGTVASIIGGYWVSVEPSLGVLPMTFIVSCLGGTVIASFLARLFSGRGPEGFLLDVSASGFVIAYLPMLGMFVALLMAPENGAMRMSTLIIATVLSDTGAYATGMLFGKHKMAPTISPAKSWEGFAGGVAWAAIGSALFGMWLLGLPWWQGAILGAVVAGAATVGDLLESLIKRDAGIKDMSNILPGHGGVMDRLDSMLLAIPVGWFVLNMAMGS